MKQLGPALTLSPLISRTGDDDDDAKSSLEGFGTHKINGKSESENSNKRVFIMFFFFFLCQFEFGMSIYGKWMSIYREISGDFFARWWIVARFFFFGKMEACDIGGAKILIIVVAIK